jgi:hypothetical protein
MTDYQIVLYGASGYTGKRCAKKLAENGMPFIAAGRNKARLEEQMARVEELKGADYRVVEVEHTAESFAKLLEGKTVVFNFVGPYMQLGEPIVQAALSAGCHYLDATGEQDWMIFLKKEYAQKYKDKGLVLSPACSAMWCSGKMTSEICLEENDIDSVDIVYALSGVPSVASTLSFMRMCCQPQYYLENNQLVEWEGAAHVNVSVPGMHQTLIALPWSGGGESIWFESDTRVRNCRTLVTFTNQALMHLIIARMKEFQDVYQHKSQEEQERVTNEWAMEIAPQGEPAAEDPLVHRCINSCHGRGTLNTHSVSMPVLGGYALTSAIGFVVIESLLAGNFQQTGFAAADDVVGKKKFLRRLQAEGAIGSAKVAGV